MGYFQGRIRKNYKKSVREKMAAEKAKTKKAKA
jgi:hypothetical protein